MENWKNKNVYVEVPNHNEYAISTRWVITTKNVEGGGMVTKARLVARGFEDDGLGDRRTDSPTMIATKGWICNTMDVETAFLQGKQLAQDIFLIPPKEANTTNIWKLNKSVYSLNEASKYWYDTADHELIETGMSKSKYDEALYYYHIRNKCHGILGLHVDDFMYGGTKYLDQSVINQIREAIKIRSEDVCPLKYVGMCITQENSLILLFFDIIKTRYSFRCL